MVEPELTLAQMLEPVLLKADAWRGIYGPHGLAVIVLADTVSVDEADCAAWLHLVLGRGLLVVV